MAAPRRPRGSSGRSAASPTSASSAPATAGARPTSSGASAPTSVRRTAAMRGRAAALLLVGAALSGCPGSQGKWTVLTDALDRVPLSAWGPSPAEVFLAGGGLGNGAPGLLLHLQGGKWTA